MSDDTTVLLVKGASLPDGLEILLEGKGVFVEQTSPADFATALTTVAPDLVLVIGIEPLDSAVSTLEGEKSQVPLVVVADRQLHRDLRQKYKAAIGTIIPTDLPDSALAHRLGTLSRRASKGEALLQAMSLAPPKPSAEPTPTKAHAPISGPSSGAKAATPMASKAMAPLGSKAAAPMASKAMAATAGKAASSAASKTAAIAGAKLSALTPSPATQPAAAPLAAKAPFEAPKPNFMRKEPRADATGRDELASMRAPAPTVPAALPGSEPKSEPKVAAKSEPQAPPSSFGEEFPTAAFQLPLEMVHKARRDSMPPETVRRAAPDEEVARLSASEALVAREIEARQRLSSSGEEPRATPTPTADDQRRATEADQRARFHRRSSATASALRLVLCDDDVTRADALASELREHGLDVMLLSPEHSQVRWPRLRRFAPHGLLVDERSLSKGGRQIVSAFRRDPFLKYVPLVVVPFQRIYREQEARANLAPVFPLLAPLGRGELGLLEQLAGKGELVVELSQILPSRLVELLADSDVTCVISTSGAGRQLTWPIGAGQAGQAELSARAGVPGSSATPEEALRFLLEQDEAEVNVAPRPHLRLTAAEPVSSLLDRVTASIEPPLQHSVAPTKSGEGAQRVAVPKATLLGVAPPAMVGGEAGPGLLPTIPAPSAPALPPRATSPGPMATHAAQPARLLAGLGPRAARLAGALQQTGGRLRGALGPLAVYLEQKRRVWPAPLFWSVVSAPALLLLLLILVWALSGSSADVRAADAAPLAPTAPASDGPSPAPAAAVPQPQLNRFLASADQPVTTCEDLIGAAPSSPGGWDASTYWKTARQALMQGNVDKAHEMMCRAVAKEPASPAAEGLASFYLARRGVGAADRYVRGVLAVDAERRTALELQSDVKNQQGKPDEALAILLRTARLDAGDTARRAVISRKFSAEAELAFKSGDLPLAERLLRRAVILSPQNDQATLRLAELFLRMGLRGPAKLWAEVLLQGPTKHAEAHMVLGDVARLDGDTQAARQHYAEVTPESGLSGRAQAQLKTLP